MLMNRVSVADLDIDQERQLLEERLNQMNNDDLYALDLQLTLCRAAHESYKRETVFKPSPNFLHGLDQDEVVRKYLFSMSFKFISII